MICKFGLEDGLFRKSVFNAPDIYIARLGALTGMTWLTWKDYLKFGNSRVKGMDLVGYEFDIDVRFELCMRLMDTLVYNCSA